MSDETKSSIGGDNNPSAQNPANNLNHSTQKEEPVQIPNTPQNISTPAHPTPKYLSKKIAILILILILLGIGLSGIIYLLGKNQNSNSNISSAPTPTTSTNSEGEEVVCTMDVKECPDGSFVSRSGPNCEFAACPTSSSEADETKNWQTYTNPKYGFVFKYPKGWKTTKLYSPESLSYTHLNLGLAPAQKVKTGYENVFAIEHYDNPNNLSFQKWDEKENEGKNMTRNLYSPDTKSVNIAGYKAYVNEKGNCDPVLCKEVIIMHNDNILVFRNLDFTNMDYTKEEIESYKPIFEQILSSLKFN